MIGDGFMGWPSTAKIKQRPTYGAGTLRVVWGKCSPTIRIASEKTQRKWAQEAASRMQGRSEEALETGMGGQKPSLLLMRDFCSPRYPGC